jgi:hypothetical protein
MKPLAFCAIGFLLLGCGLSREQDISRATVNTQNSLAAYKTCMDIHYVDPQSCDSYREAWQADERALEHLKQDSK